MLMSTKICKSESAKIIYALWHQKYYDVLMQKVNVLLNIKIMFKNLKYFIFNVDKNNWHIIHA